MYNWADVSWNTFRGDAVLQTYELRHMLIIVRRCKCKQLAPPPRNSLEQQYVGVAISLKSVTNLANLNSFTLLTRSACAPRTYEKCRLAPRSAVIFVLNFQIIFRIFNIRHYLLNPGITYIVKHYHRD